MYMLAYTLVEFKSLETLAKTFINHARENQFIHKNIFNTAPVLRNANAMITKSAFTESHTGNTFWYQQFDMGQIRLLRGGQLIVDFDAAHNGRLYVTTMKALNIQDDIPSIPIDSCKNHYVLVFDLTSKQDASDIFHYPELEREPLRLELNVTYSLMHVAELIALGERMSSVAVDKFAVVGKDI